MNGNGVEAMGPGGGSCVVCGSVTAKSPEVLIKIRILGPHLKIPNQSQLNKLSE